MADHLQQALVRRLVVPAVLVGLLVVGVAPTALAAAAPPRIRWGDVNARTPGAEMFRSDSAAYRGSYSAVGFSAFGNSRQYLLKNVRANVELPRSWANRFCAYARIGINEVAVSQTYRDCDTDGDGMLEFRFPDMQAHPGDYVGVWFSDPVTLYRVTHPEVRL